MLNRLFEYHLDVPPFLSIKSGAKSPLVSQLPNACGATQKTAEDAIGDPDWVLVKFGYSYGFGRCKLYIYMYMISHGGLAIPFVPLPPCGLYTSILN